MIKLEINRLKELSVRATSKVYKGENMINSIQITATDNSIGEKRLDDCELWLHVVFPNGEYIAYPVVWSENSIPPTGFIPITGDLTAEAQVLELYVEALSSGAVIGKTNTVFLQVFSSPDEQTALTPREQLEETISELEEELESASTLTELLEELSGSYDSFPERIIADEANISANASDIGTHSAAIVSLTAALNNKIDNLPSSVSNSNLSDGSVTIPKLAASAFDGAPTLNSNNILKSGTIYNALASKISFNSYVGGSDGMSLAQINALSVPQYSINWIFVAANVLYTGSLKQMCLIFTVNSDTEVFLNTEGRIFKRDYDNLNEAWGAITEIYAAESRVAALENTVGVLNTQLENALNGGA